MGRNIVETIVGALVLVVAGVFVFYAFAKSDRGGPAGYEIVARFDRREQAEKLREAIDQLAHEGRLSAISAKYPLVGYRSAEFLTAMTQLRNERRLLRAGFVAACAVLAVALLLAWRMRQNARRLRRADRKSVV